MRRMSIIKKRDLMIGIFASSPPAKYNHNDNLLPSLEIPFVVLLSSNSQIWQKWTLQQSVECWDYIRPCYTETEAKRRTPNCAPKTTLMKFAIFCLCYYITIYPAFLAWGMPSDEHFLRFHFIIFVMNLSDFNVVCIHVWWAEHVTQNGFFILYIWNLYLGNGKNVSELKISLNGVRRKRPAERIYTR